MGFSGTDSFAYTVKDNHGATSAAATVTVAVTAAFPWRRRYHHGVSIVRSAVAIDTAIPAHGCVQAPRMAAQSGPQ